MVQITVTDTRTGEERRIESPPLVIRYEGPNQTYIYVGGEQVGMVLHLKFEASCEKVFPRASVTFDHPDTLSISEELKTRMWKNIRRIYPLGMRIFLRDAEGVDREWCNE